MHGAAVAAEQLDDARLAGHHRGQAAQRERGGDEDEHAEQDQGGRGAAGEVDGGHDQRHAGEHGDDAEHQHPQTGHEPRG